MGDMIKDIYEKRKARERKWRQECAAMGREPGPFGCLCEDLHHHCAGDGCCICQPEEDEG